MIKFIKELRYVVSNYRKDIPSKNELERLRSDYRIACDNSSAHLEEFRSLQNQGAAILRDVSSTQITTKALGLRITMLRADFESYIANIKPNKISPQKAVKKLNATVKQVADLHKYKHIDDYIAAITPKKRGRPVGSKKAK